MGTKKQQEKKVTPLEASNIASQRGFPVTTATIRNWCERYKIGDKIGGRWLVDVEQLEKVLSGEI